MKSFLTKLPGLIWKYRILLALILVVAVFAVQLALLKKPEAEGAYTIANSLRFLPASSSYLNRTPASAGNRKTWTFSGWYKLNQGSSQILQVGPDGSNRFFMNLGTAGLQIGELNVAVQTNHLYSTAIYRDPAAWVHLVVAFDTTQAAPADRIKAYIDGKQLDSFTADNRASLAQNSDRYVNNTGAHYIGSNTVLSGFADYYASDIYLVDGQALAPTAFGEVDGNGYWRPKEYAGTYGTNGFHLDFSNGASLGTDASGTGNNWTVNALTSVDQVVDTPTNSFATLNPLNVTSVPIHTVTAGNLSALGTAAATRLTTGTMGAPSGKWYYEATVTSHPGSSGSINFGLQGTTSQLYGSDGQIYKNAASQGVIAATFTTGDVIGIAWDIDNASASFYKNNTLQTTQTGLSGLVHAVPRITSSAANAATFNFGQGGQSGLTYDSASGGYFKYTPPSGYKALSTNNLPEPAVAVSKNYFDAVPYTGTGAARTVGAGTPTRVFLTSGTSWTVPADWNSASNTIEVIGGGAGGAGSIPASYGSGAGGGGAYSKSVNVALQVGTTTTYAVGSGGSGGAASTIGGNGGDTYFCNTNVNCASITGTAVVVGAKGGSTGTVNVSTNATGGAGGASASGIGSTKYSGGAGGNSTASNGGGGGGGAAGPLGAGGAGATSNASGSGAGGGGNGGGSSATSLPGGNNAQGTGGGAAGTSGVAGAAGTNGGGGGGGFWNGSVNSNGGAGGAGVEWTTHGSGGGGASGAGGGGVGGTIGRAGGLYGAGGGGGSGVSSAGGAGAQGVIVITYTPITTPGFQPGLVWIKNRTDAVNHALFDSVRGVQKFFSSNASSVEDTDDTQSLSGFNTQGFSLGTGASTANVNTVNKNYISWLWRESAASGFDIVTYTGTGVGMWVNHSLGATPEMIIVKALSTTSDPVVGHASLNGGNSPFNNRYFMLLDSTAAEAASATIWGGNPTATQFYVGTDSRTNGAATTNTVYLTSGTSWTVPSDWNSASNTVEVIGGGQGGAGSSAGRGGDGGYGGGYAKVSNLVYTPGASVAYAVGAGGTGGASGAGGGGNGGITFFGGTLPTNCANGGVTVCGGGGVAGANNYGSTTYSGGTGGTGGTTVSTIVNTFGGGGGGGAAGPHGAGNNGGGAFIGGSGTTYYGGAGGGGHSGGSSGDSLTPNAFTSGSAGGNNRTGSGGGTAGVGAGSNGGAGTAGGGGGGGGGAATGASTSGGAGSAGQNWDSTHGSGGGGGGGGSGNSGTGVGGAGGLYGGGGGGGARAGGAGGNGAQGIIKITYSPTTGAGAYVAYLFNEVEGFSKFGSYTGNGSTDGPFIYTGFKPRYILNKRADAAGNNWIIHDTARVPYNLNNIDGAANLTNVDATGQDIDILANGFKIRTTAGGMNTSAGTYIYAAFAEQPLKYSAAPNTTTALSGFVQAVAFLMGMPY